MSTRAKAINAARRLHPEADHIAARVRGARATILIRRHARVRVVRYVDLDAADELMASK